MDRILSHPRTPPALLFLASTGLLGGAFLFQYVGGLAPCALCIWQRYPHGIALGLSLVALLIPLTSRRARGGLLLLTGLVLLAGGAIAAFHAGVELKWWEGLPSCSGGPGLPSDMNLKDITKAANAGPAPRCDEVPWSLFGISMAGWNFLISLALGGFALIAARKQLKTR